jgi:hypothetical protein
MASLDTFRAKQYTETLCRGDSLTVAFAVNNNVALDDCSPLVLGDPISLAGYTVRGSARVEGTGVAVAIVVSLLKVGGTTAPANFGIQISRDNLALAFEEGSTRVIDVRVEATRGSDTFTLLQGTINMRESADPVGS